MGNLNTGTSAYGTKIWIQNYSNRRTRFEHKWMHWFIDAVGDVTWRSQVCHWATYGDVTVWADNDASKSILIQEGHTYWYGLTYEGKDFGSYRGKPRMHPSDPPAETFTKVSRISLKGKERWVTLRHFSTNTAGFGSYNFTYSYVTGSVDSNGTRAEKKDMSGWTFETTVSGGEDKIWGVKQSSKFETKAETTRGTSRTLTYDRRTEKKDSFTIDNVVANRHYYIIQRVIEYGVAPHTAMFATDEVKLMSYKTRTEISQLRSDEAAVGVKIYDVWKKL